MFAKLLAKYGRKIVMWGVIAVTSALARKAMEKWASRGGSTETDGAAAGT